MVPLRELLDLVPAALLEKLALAYQVDKANQVRLTGQTVFVCLLNSFLNHARVTQRLLEDSFACLTGKTTHYSSFSYRLGSIRVDYFDALFTHLYRQVRSQLTRGAQPVLRHRIADATIVTLSSKLIAFGIRVAGKSGKGHGSYDLRQVKSVVELSLEGLPRLLHLCSKQAEANDNPALGDPIIEQCAPGDCWLFDSGCFDRDRLLKIHQKKAFFLTPHHGQGLRCLRPLGEAPPAPAPDSASDGAAQAAELPKRSVREPASYRLLRVEEAVFENSNDAVKPSRRRKWGEMPLVVLYGERYDERSKQWKPLVLLSNLPVCADGEQAGPYTFLELAELYRLRWRIEVLFKFLKQHLSYDHLTSRKENGIQVMIRMALIAAVLLIWYRKRSGIDRGWRSVKFRFAEDARAWTAHLIRRDLRQCLASPT
jgi:Transposase DDE domain